jgi:hypothetical protein
VPPVEPARLEIVVGSQQSSLGLQLELQRVALPAVVSIEMGELAQGPTGRHQHPGCEHQSYSSREKRDGARNDRDSEPLRLVGCELSYR